MKKLIAMATALLLSVGAYAQHEVGSVTIQPKIGMNIASMTDLDDADVRIGLAIGAEAEYQFTDMFSISGGLLYSMQGYTDDGGGTDYTCKMDYLNVPILVNCYVVKGLAVKLGIQPGFNINAKAKAEGQKLGLNSEELAFYDALTKPQAIKDFYKHDELIYLTKELTDELRRNRTIDWEKKESARAGMRRLVKRLLKKYKYPPEGMEDAVKTVISQCEMWTDNYDYVHNDMNTKYTYDDMQYNNYYMAAESREKY